MSNTYLYNVVNLIRDSKDGIVVGANFTITASNGTDSYTVNSQTAFPAPTGAIIPYDQLTEAEVIGWIENTVGTQSEELADSELAAYIERKNQPTANGTPW
jgi:hypothetical protein